MSFVLRFTCLKIKKEYLVFIKKSDVTKKDINNFDILSQHV